MAEILKDVFEDEKGNQHYLANNTETTFDQNGTPLNNGGDLSEASVNFTVSSSRKALTAKARFKALMGDIAKWLTDLGPAAFYKVADDFTTTAENYLFTARKGKQLKDEVDNLNQDLGGLSFYEDETGKYVIGADSVPKKLGSDVKVYAITQTTNGSLNISSDFADYANITADNINIGITGGWTEHTYTSATGHTYVYAQIVSYDPATGVITYKLYSNGNVGAYQLNGYIIVHGS